MRGLSVQDLGGRGEESELSPQGLGEPQEDLE